MKAASLPIGATHAVNAVREDMKASVKQVTGSRLAEYVFVAVGRADASEILPRWLELFLGSDQRILGY